MFLGIKAGEIAPSPYPAHLIQPTRSVQLRMARHLMHKLHHQPMQRLHLMLQRLQARGHSVLNYYVPPCCLSR